MNELETMRVERLGTLARRIDEAERNLERLLRESNEWPQSFEALSRQMTSLAADIESIRSRDPSRYEDSRLQFLKEAEEALTRPSRGEPEGKPLGRDEAKRELSRPCFSCRHAQLAITRTDVNVGCRNLPDGMIFTGRGPKARVFGTTGTKEGRRQSGIPEIEYCPHWEALLKPKPRPGD